MATTRQGLLQIAPIAGLAAAAALGAAGCAVNPATGDRQLMLVSESQEIEIGRDADKEITVGMGVYDDPALASYVEAVGKQMAALSERPDLPWTFRVIDDPVVNAFALPGGYIYVTRGILAHLSSEAELAAVIGHEIGHVTARHGASRLSKAQIAQIGLGVGAVASPEFARYAGVAQLGLGLLFLKYSRDDERQADDLGLRYSLRGGYDAREMPEVFEVLRRVSEASGGGGGGMPSWLSTHPDPEARGERIRQQIASSEVDLSKATVNRAGYVAQLDGLVFGADPRQGFFRDHEFLHPDLAFRAAFPRGWKLANQRASVDGVSSKQDAAVQLTLVEAADPESAMSAFAGQEGITAGRVQRGRVGGFPSAGAEFETAGEAPLRGRVAFVRYREKTFRLLGYSVSDRWGDYEGEARRFIESFGELEDREALNVQPARVQIVKLSKELPLEAFERQYPSTVPLETLALINHVTPPAPLPAGVGAKRIVGGPPPGF
jgi:predicted Zn-dependent protease